MSNGNEFEIKNDLPIPATWDNGQFPFAAMQVGDHITTRRNGITGSAMAFARKHGWEFVWKYKDGETTIWRKK